MDTPLPTLKPVLLQAIAMMVKHSALNAWDSGLTPRSAVVVKGWVAHLHKLQWLLWTSCLCQWR